MSAPNDEVRKVLQLLAKGQHQEGVRSAEKVKVQLSKLRSDLQQQITSVEHDLAVLDEITQTPRGVSRPHTQPAQMSGSKPNPAQFRRAVLKAAENLAIATPNGEVTTQGIAAAIQTEFPSPNKTAIGIILNGASAEWDKIDSGFYRFKGKTAHANGSNGTLPIKEVADHPV